MPNRTNHPMNNPENRRAFKFFQLLAAICTLMLASCTSWLPDAHRIDITQGNAINREALEKIQPGMKKAEITPILGSPLISDPFHAERWDYIYRYTPGRGEPTQSRITLFFEGEILVRIDDSEYKEPEPQVTESDESEP